MSDPDELARTATAMPSDPSKPAGGAAAGAPLGATLGRYRLERTLGEGGMGVVHAAFDPDLERRVALKVLRAAHGDDARQRLLREARAMARLTHANVVTVYEVGSVDGRDYVAMELVDGESLEQWLRAATRTTSQIVDAFVSAGRGLAAAHAAGLVHRDFKPHNVLRRRDGRIAVTDFGLARGVDDPAFATTMTAGSPTAATTPSSLSGLTATGSVLGTPAYMAPEQWSGEVVGPAADQFAFCVALWEALTGERPFRGATLDQLKTEVQRGPGELDASKLPRLLRRALRRGLARDPAKRWPSMDALLAAIARAERTPGVALVAVLAIAGIAGGVYLAVRDTSPAIVAAACEQPALDPAVAWAPADAAAMRAAGRGDIADALDRDVLLWTATRDRACAAPTEKRIAQLACLDGVLARLAAVRQASAKLSGDVGADAIGDWLVAPSVCTAATPPHLALTAAPDTVTAIAYSIDADRPGTKLPEAELAAFVARPGLEPCARAIAQLALGDLTSDAPRARAAVADGVTSSDACGDARLIADALIVDAPFEYEVPTIGERGRAAIAKASTAVDRVAQPDLAGQIALMRAQLEAQDLHFDAAFAAADTALLEFGARGRKRAQVQAIVRANELRAMRGDAVDVATIRANAATWLPVARALRDDRLVESLERSDAFCRWILGDPGGQAELMRLWNPGAHGGVPTRPVDGVVVDREGKPVAGALVAANVLVFLDSRGPLPLPGVSRSMRIATTAADGTFAIADATTAGAIIAQHDGLRSDAIAVAPHVKLVLGPVRRLAGTADLGGRDATTSFVTLEPLLGGTNGYRMMVPIASTGAFSIDGAPTGKLQIGIATRDGFDTGSMEMIELPASTTEVDGIRLKLSTTTRTLDVTARSATAQTFDAAQVFVFVGRIELHSGKDLTEHAQSGGMRVQFARPGHDGDLIAHFIHVPEGELTACAIGLNGNFHDPKFGDKIQAHLADLALRCEPVGAAATTITIEAPAQKRFD